MRGYFGMAGIWIDLVNRGFKSHLTEIIRRMMFKDMIGGDWLRILGVGIR